MRFDAVTLFPEIFSAVRDCGITNRALKRGLWQLELWNPRDCASSPRPIHSESSRPTRMWPPDARATAPSGIWWRPAPSTDHS